MNRRKLTDKFIKALKKAPAGKRVPYYDSLVPEMAVRLTDTGHKSFVLVTRYPSQPKSTTPRRLGDYPGTTLDAARETARDWLRLIERGIDPKDEEARLRAEEAQRKAEAEQREEEEARQRANTWGVVVDAFLEQRAAKMAKANEARTVLKGELGNRWGAKPILDITDDDVAEAFMAVVERGAPYHARNVLIWIKSLFSWAIAARVYKLTKNPALAIDATALLGEKKPRKRTLSDDELREVWHGAADLGEPYGPLVRLLMLTGQRRDEIGEASRGEMHDVVAEAVDGGRHKVPCLVIPPERMKMDNGHIVPLVPAVAGIFESIAAGEKGQYIFSTTDGALPVDGFSKAKDRLDVAIMRRKEAEAQARPANTLAVTVATQREAKGKDVRLVATGHAPFKETDEGRIVGIRHGDHWGYARVTEFMSPRQVAARILSAFDSTKPSDVWAIGPEHWTFQDLRRTVRTRLSRLQVPYEVRELVIAHVKKGTDKTYDWHGFVLEKRDALQKWANALRDIVEPPPANVVPIEEERERRAKA